MASPRDTIAQAFSRLLRRNDLDVPAPRPVRHEIPLGKESRRTVRVPIALRIAVRFDTINDVLNCRTLDVSRGGMFIRTRAPRPVGTRVSMRLTVADRDLPLTGKVIHSVSLHDPSGLDPGMGVRFDDLPPAVESALDELIAGLG